MRLRLAVNAVPLRSSLTDVRQYVRYLMEAVEARGDEEIRYFYGTHWGRRLIASPVGAVDSAKRFVKRTVPHPYFIMRTAQRPIFAVGLLAFRPQVYHEPNYVSFPFRGPIVLTVHDLSFVHFPELQPRDRVKHLERYLVSALATAAHIITDSEAVRSEAITHFGLNPGRVTAIHLGVGSEFAPRERSECAEALARYHLRYREYVLAVGTLEPRKNLGATIQAFAALPDRLRRRTPLVVAGQRGWLSEEIDRLIRRAEAAGWLRFLGYVPQADLPNIYAGAHLFVYPSRYEGFGLPVVEAMASGAPVITSSVSCLPEVASNAAELVHPDDEDGLRATLVRLLEDESRSAELRSLGLARAKQFTWQRCAEETVAIYRTVAGA